MKLLLVEDSSRMRGIMKTMLVAHVPTIDVWLECENGEEAVEAYRTQKPDWVLMDIKLPVRDGLQATRDIMAMDPAAKVIIVTQYNDPVYREEARAIGACGFVLKENLHDLPQMLIS
jgi:DNA-binding NarL/FixJ family response regulator